MSGGSVAYQLRPNKAVDRNLLIDLLNKLNRIVNISDYRYFGFGGPFLEDFKLMHAHLRIAKMTSIEQNKDVHLRQKFNSPLSCINFVNKPSSEFIESEPFDDLSIVWLDYTDPAKIGEQLKEIEYLVTKLSRSDILKITLNSNPSALGGKATEEKDLQEVRLQILESRLNEYFPSGTQPEMLVHTHFGKVIFKALELAIKKGMRGKGKEYFQVLSSFLYKDGGHEMLTVTGILLEDDKEKIDNFFNGTRLLNWPLGLFEWSVPKVINVPELSVKERIHIDNLLPQNDCQVVKNSLGYCIDGDDVEMNSLIENYINYYRSYPLFSKVVL
jgi:hypothetical protein